jgi:cytochrome c biogenesis protein ResB
MAVKKVIVYHGGALFRPWSLCLQNENEKPQVIKRFSSIVKARKFRDDARSVQLYAKRGIFTQAFNLVEHNLAIVTGVAIASAALSAFGIGH